MKPCSCLSPIRIYNKALHCFIHVPCGHCEACNVIKGYRRSEKVNAAFNTFVYRYFVTLTYRDECLPIARYDSDLFRLVSDDVDYNGELYNVSLSSDCCRLSQDFISSSVEKYGGVPVLSHSDLINFKKRLRKYVKEKLGFYPPIFLYSVGEYGPSHFRPHFHLCIGFNDRRIVSIFRECIHKAWTMFNKYSSETDFRLIGKVDIQSVVGRGTTNYCASYLNCTTYLPKVLSSSIFRPFSSKSSTSDFQLSRTGSTDLREIFFRCSIYETFVDSETNKVCTTLASDLYRNRYFPKCSSFGLLSHADRVTLYRAFERYGYLSFALDGSYSVNNFSNYFIESRNQGFPFKNNFIKLLDTYFITNDRFSSLVKLNRLFYVSRKVCINASTLGITVDSYVSQIELFYQKIESDKLSRFYHSIEDFMSDPYCPMSLSQVFHLYYETSPSISSFDYYRDQFGVHDRSFVPSELPHQRFYEIKMRKIALDNTKTKKRNDDFDSRGISRPPWLLIQSRRKSKFKTLFS